MASAKDLRKRITSVKNTQQITKAMKMVAAAKLRRAQDNIVSLRPYAKELNKVLAALTQSSGGELKHPLLTSTTASATQVPPEKVLFIVVTSDRGLCGAFNGSIIKATQKFIASHSGKYKKFDLAFIGKKGFEFYKNKKPGKYYQGFFTGLNFVKADTLAKELIQLYLSGEYDEIKFIYNEFKSAISQKVTIENFLPINASGGSVPDETRSLSGAESSEGSGHSTSESELVNHAPTIFEPGANQILDSLLPKYFATQIFRILLESLASEHGARMSAMESATKNAGEMIRKITLLYNKTRQAAITKELLEITSGAEAQKA